MSAPPRRAFCLALLILLVVFALGLPCGGAWAQPATARGRAPDFVLRDLGGHDVRLSDYLGKVVLLDFWATWCVPCEAALPHIQALYQKYRDQGLVVLGIDMDDSKSVAQVASFAQRYKLSFPVLLDEETRVVEIYDPKGSAPYQVLIGRSGAIAKERQGYNAGDEKLLEAEILSLLRQRAPGSPGPSPAISPAVRQSALDFTVRGVPVHLNITDSLFFGYHSFAEPLSPDLGPPYGDPLNPLSGLLFCSGAANPQACQKLQGFGHNYLPLTRGQAGQEYFDIFNRFNIFLSAWRVQAGLRIDTTAFLNPPQPADPRNLDAGGCGEACESRFQNHYVSPTGVEKAFVTYAGRDLEVTLGDSYVVFGRGLVLSVRKVDELGIDTTVLGAKAAYHSGPFKLVAVGGVSNIQNIDEATGRFQADPFDLIAGARGEVRLWDKLIVGAHAAGGALANDGVHAPYSTGRLGYGGTIEAPRLLPWLDLYLEGDGLQLFQGAGQSAVQNTGYALYGSATIYSESLTVLLEGKQYSHFVPWQGSTTYPEFSNIAYNQPPTVERVLTELEDPQTQVGGGRVLFTYRAAPAFSLVASSAVFRQRAYGMLVTHSLSILDPYAGVQTRWQGGVSHLFGNGGYRTEHDDDHFQMFKRTGWFDWDFAQALPRNLSIESQGQALFRTREGEPDWVEGNAYAAVKWAPYLVGALGLEWSTRQQTVAEEGKRYAQYGIFPNGSIQYNISTRTSVRFFAGGLRGGLKCISGICRVYPDLRGARLEVVLRL